MHHGDFVCGLPQHFACCDRPSNTISLICKDFTFDLLCLRTIICCKHEQCHTRSVLLCGSVFLNSFFCPRHVRAQFLHSWGNGLWTSLRKEIHFLPCGLAYKSSSAGCSFPAISQCRKCTCLVFRACTKLVSGSGGTAPIAADTACWKPHCMHRC